MKRTYRYNSEWMPRGFKHDFDAHIYFKPTEFDVITGLKEALAREIQSAEIFIGDIIPEPIGPHTLPMLEVNFSKAQYNQIVGWLERERKGLNILVHPQSGDDYDDHTQGAVWLGQAVPLKLEVF